MPDQPAIPSTATDPELLRAFEPVVRFTGGEQFFPMDVERYVRACSLWLYHPDDHDEQVIAEGELTMDKLIEPRAASAKPPSPCRPRRCASAGLLSYGPR